MAKQQSILVVSADRAIHGTVERLQSFLPQGMRFAGATSGRDAIHVLKNHPCSLVATILPVRFSAQLFGEMLRSFPALPRLTASRPENLNADQAVRQFNAYIATHAAVTAEQICLALFDALGAPVAGENYIEDASLLDTLALAACDERSCAIHVRNSDSGEQATLYLLAGELVGAHAGNLKDGDAATEILTWPRVGISIHDGCSVTENRIGLTLEQLLAGELPPSGQFSSAVEGGQSEPPPLPQPLPAVEAVSETAFLKPPDSPEPASEPAQAPAVQATPEPQRVPAAAPPRRSLKEILASEYVELPESESEPAPEPVPAAVAAAPAPPAAPADRADRSLADKLNELVDFTPGKLTNGVSAPANAEPLPNTSRFAPRKNHTELATEGMDAFRAGNFAAARDSWTEALRQKPDDKSLQYNLRQAEKRLAGGRV